MKYLILILIITITYGLSFASVPKAPILVASANCEIFGGLFADGSIQFKGIEKCKESIRNYLVKSAQS